MDSSNSFPEETPYEVFKQLANYSTKLFRHSQQERREGYSQALREVLVYLGQRSSQGSAVSISALAEFITKLEQTNGRSSVNSAPPQPTNYPTNSPISSDGDNNNDAEMNSINRNTTSNATLNHPPHLSNQTQPSDTAILSHQPTSTIRSLPQVSHPNTSQPPQLSTNMIHSSQRMPTSAEFSFKIPGVDQTQQQNLNNFAFGNGHIPTLSQLSIQTAQIPATRMGNAIFAPTTTGSYYNSEQINFFEGVMDSGETGKRRWGDFGSKQMGLELMAGLDFQATKRVRLRKDEKMSD